MDNPNLLKLRYRKSEHTFGVWHYIVIFLIGFLIGTLISFEADAEEIRIINNYKPAAAEHESRVEIVENPYLTINISDEEYNELRWVVALESGNSLEDKKAVTEVILNRCLSQKHNWGGSVHGVLSKKGQFSTYKLIGSKKAWKQPGELEDDAISEVLRCGLTVLPSYSYVYFDSKGGRNGKAHIKIKGGNTYGAE